MAESNRIEYKQQLTDSLEKEVVAFLNYPDGGIIYIGVNDDGSPYGISNVDKVQLAVKDRLKHNILPSALGLFDVIHENRDGKDLIKIIVASGSEKPYHLRKYGMSEKGCFIRIGSASEPMPTRMIEDLFSQRTRNSLSRIRSIRQDLSFEQLRIYYQEAGLTLNDKFAANLELLTEDGFYNYNGYLMADQNGNTVQVAKYAGTDRVDLLESKDYGFCCLVKTCKMILDKLEAVENRVINQITPRERINRSYWDTVALREAVINAIIHNDYATELVPKFEIFTDRLEITSAASIHPGQEQEYFFAGYSMPRNKAIMRVFKDLEMVEFLGSGIPRILKAYPRESYTFSSYFVRTTFPISPEALALEDEVKREATEEKDADDTPISGTMGGTIGGTIELTQRQKEVLSIIKANPTVSYRAIVEMLSINKSALEKHMNVLKKKGVLKRIGGTRGHWEVTLKESNDA
ncbi:RNA-binding domain-containing protein [Desulfamplus magnetovallimortis]|nr:RNA-binding domain-containing protein [Desulfamplus magnetovallimortis]